MGYDIPSGNLLRFAIENIEIVDLPLRFFFHSELLVCQRVY